MKIVIAGGTGMIGSYLNKMFHGQKTEILIISRNKEHVSWEQNDLINALEDADLLINLAGRSINCRHNKKNREAILNSRLVTTQKLGNAIKICKNPPKLWINVSASAIYSSKLKTPASEYSTDFADDFLSSVIQKWEKQFFDLNTPKTRQVALRTSVVLSKLGGAFPQLYGLTKLGFGGKYGNGNQMFSWIHIEDFYRIVLHVFKNEDIKGIVNCTSPQPITNRKLMETLRLCTGVKIGIPTPALFIKIGTFFLRTESDLILNSSSLYPKVLLGSGFIFKYVTIQKSILSLLNK